MITRFRWADKDPDETDTRCINWEADLSNDTIAISTWSYTGSPDHVPLVLPSDSFTDKVATVWLGAGTPNTTYSVRNRITTVGLRVLEKTMLISVRQA